MRSVMGSLVALASLLCLNTVACTSAEETCNNSRVAAHEAWNAAQAKLATFAGSAQATYDSRLKALKSAEDAANKKEMWTPFMSKATDPELKRLRKAVTEANEAAREARGPAEAAKSLSETVDAAVAASALPSALQARDALNKIRPSLPQEESISKALSLSDASYEACKAVSP